MKTIIFTLLLLFTFIGNSLYAQSGSSEKYGKTLNAGLGIGYYRYATTPMPVIHADFEFDVVRNFTLAPFITFYSYRNYHYWGNSNHPYREYSYRTTVIPVGIKGAYYFDQLFHAGSKWDFYGAGSLGFAIRSTRWENGYYGETDVHRGTSALYIDVHAGVEHHATNSLGFFLDLSTGISTIGLAVHL